MFCPQEVLRMSDHLNEQGRPYPEMVDELKKVRNSVCSFSLLTRTAAVDIR
jgi:hypothetical protein